MLLRAAQTANRSRESEAVDVARAAFDSIVHVWRVGRVLSRESHGPYTHPIDNSEPGPILTHDSMLSPETLLLSAAAFLLAGFVKGVIGMGMPTVSLAVMSIAMGLPTAIQIVVVPTVVTNVWQALIGDGLRRLVRRFAVLLAATVIGVWLGYFLLFRSSAQLMTAVLGAAIIVYSLSGLLGFPLMPKVRRERLASPLVGVATGVLAGATGNISMPAIAYFHRLDLARNDIVQMLGILFTLGATTLGLTLAGHGSYEPDLLLVSALAVVPSIIGMLIGQRVRAKLAEKVFRRALFVALLAAGAHLVWKGLAFSSAA